jgi:hypothetical protein
MKCRKQSSRKLIACSLLQNNAQDSLFEFKPEAFALTRSQVNGMPDSFHRRGMKCGSEVHFFYFSLFGPLHESPGPEFHLRLPTPVDSP